LAPVIAPSAVRNSITANSGEPATNASTSRTMSSVSMSARHLRLGGRLALPQVVDLDHHVTE
jgi:hypothetical protein